MFNTDTKELYVEHEWDHVNVRGGGEASKGTVSLTIDAYLNEGGQDAGHRELTRLLQSLFADT